MGFSPYRVSSIYIYTSVDPPHIHVAGFPFVVQRVCRTVGLVGGLVLEGRQNFDHNSVRMSIAMASEFRSQFSQTSGRAARCRSVCPCVRPSACPFFRMSICPSVRIPVCPMVVSRQPPSTVSCQPSYVRRQPSAISREPSAVRRQPS